MIDISERSSRVGALGFGAQGIPRPDRHHRRGRRPRRISKAAELERRLLELGFVEGAHVEILHEGPLGRDPIAVRVNDTTIALRRREAMASWWPDRIDRHECASRNERLAICPGRDAE